MRAMFLSVVFLLISFSNLSFAACGPGTIDWQIGPQECPSGPVSKLMCTTRKEKFTGTCRCTSGCEPKDRSIINASLDCTWQPNSSRPNEVWGKCGVFGRPTNPSNCACKESSPPTPPTPPTPPKNPTTGIDPKSQSCKALGGPTVSENNCDPKIYGTCKCAQPCGPGCANSSREVRCNCEIKPSGMNEPVCSTSYLADNICKQ
jgi:hypothetical protein